MQSIQQSHLIYQQQSNQPAKLQEPQNQDSFATFIFPIKILDKNIINGIEQFKKLLEIQYQSCKIYTKLFNISILKIKNGRYPVIRCRFCKAKIKYEANQDNSYWKLVQYDNKHNHLKKQEIILNKKIRNRKALQTIDFIKRQKIENQMQQSIDKLTKKYDQDKKFEVFENILIKLNYGYRFKYLCNKKQGLNSFPDLLVCVTQKNKNDYRRYGEILTYNLRYITIRECNVNVQYGIGLICGYDENSEMVVFGVTISNKEGRQQYLFIWRSFIELIGEIKTETIIIKYDDVELKNGLQMLKIQNQYKYIIIYDTIDYLNKINTQLKTKIKHKNLIKSLIQMLAYAISSPNIHITQKIIYQIHAILSQHNCNQISKSLNQNSAFLFLTHIDSDHFVGISRTTHQSTIHKLFNSDEQYSILSILKYIESYRRVGNSLQKYNFEGFYNEQRWRVVRKRVNWKILALLLQRYEQCLVYRLVYEKQGQYCIEHMIRGQEYIIKNNRCVCMSMNKIGIGCEHVLYINMILGNNERWYQKVISERWMIDNIKQQQTIPK